MTIDRIRPGKGIPARTLRLFAEKADGLSRISASPPLCVSTVAGAPLLSITPPAEFWARLTGSSSPYSLAEVYGTPGGGWATLTGGRAGTSNAYEANAVSGLNSKVVRVQEGVPGDYRFRYIRSGTAGPPVYSCAGCTTIPGTLYLRAPSPGTPTGWYRDADLVYQPCPPWMSTPLGTGAGDVWLSATTVLDPYIGGSNEFYPFVFCNNLRMEYRVAIVRQGSTVYPTPYTGGGFYVYKWYPAAAGNTCSPFSYTNGSYASDTTGPFALGGRFNLNLTG